jgi:hypothetical protein
MSLWMVGNLILLIIIVPLLVAMQWASNAASRPHQPPGRHPSP